MVVFFHVNIIMAMPEYGGVSIYDPIASLGSLGVEYFFVISGFIIFFAHHKDIGVPARASNYARKRFTRIYPIYWLYTAVFVAMGAVGLGHPDYVRTFWNLASSMLLIGIDDSASPPLKVAWTLFYEVRFYLAFLVLIWNRKAGIFLFALWIAAILVSNLLYRGQVIAALDVRNIAFLTGGLAFWVYHLRLGAERRRHRLLVLGVVLSVAGSYARLEWTHAFVGAYQAIDVVFSFAFALILLALAEMERAGELKIPALPVLIGNASYSVYLVHSAVISAGIIVLIKLGLPARLGPHGTFWVLFVGAAFGGVCAYVLVESPLLKLLRRVSFLAPQAKVRYGD